MRLGVGDFATVFLKAMPQFQKGDPASMALSALLGFWDLRPGYRAVTSLLDFFHPEQNVKVSLRIFNMHQIHVSGFGLRKVTSGLGPLLTCIRR